MLRSAFHPASARQRTSRSVTALAGMTLPVPSVVEGGGGELHAPSTPLATSAQAAMRRGAQLSKRVPHPVGAYC